MFFKVYQLNYRMQYFKFKVSISVLNHISYPALDQSANVFVHVWIALYSTSSNSHIYIIPAG